MVSPLKSLQSELVLKLDEIMDLCSRYNYKATPTLLLRHNDGAKASIMIGGDEPKEVVLCLAELGVTGNKSELSVRDAAIQSLMSEVANGQNHQ